MKNAQTGSISLVTREWVAAAFSLALPSVLTVSLGASKEARSISLTKSLFWKHHAQAVHVMNVEVL